VRIVATFASAAASVLALAPAAFAHGSVRPTVATPGATQQFTFLVLNAREAGIVAFRLELPAGATVEEVTARQPEWIATSSANRVEWRGGPIPARAFDSFQVRVKMPDGEGTASFRGTEVFQDGPGPPYRFDVVLAGGGAIGNAEATDEGARTLGKAALVVAIGAALLAAAALGLSILRWRRPTS
jgi:uncharacterized protein YcnI